MLFTRQLSAMLSSGLPLSKSLATIIRQTDKPRFKAILEKVALDVKNGKPFAESLSRSGAFSSVYCGMVSVGETGASLDGILDKLGRYLEKQEKIKGKIISAMMYPAVILLIAILVIFALLLFVIPNFTQMFGDAGRELPAATQTVISLSAFLAHNILFILLGTLALLALVVYALKTPNIRLVIDDYLLKVPLIGMLVRKQAISRFAGTLGALLQAGVPLTEAMKITASTAGNKAIESAILRSLSLITRGREISKPLEETGLFPPMVIQMVAVGEETGKLPDMLNKLSEFYDTEVDTAVNRVTSVLEPLMILGLGAIVAALLVAMYLPMFDMVGNVQ